MQKYIDYRTDAVTLATQEMRQAMADAEVGDDYAGEDPTVNKLEAMSANMFGKEAAMFVISGTMANQIAVMASMLPGDEVLVGEEAHIYNFENGGLAALSGVQARPLRSNNGQFDFNDIRKALKARGVQNPPARMLCLENTYDLNRGIPLSAEYISETAKLAHENGLMVYLDGARIFNASIAQGIGLDILCSDVDAMQFSLCKALSAPVGCMLLGTKEFIEKARIIRHRMGGAMAQAGHMAAAGIVALNTMIDRIKDDHSNAKRLAEGIGAIDERLVSVEKTLTNIVQVNFKSAGKNTLYIANKLENRGIKVRVIDSTSCRFVTHNGITTDDIYNTIESLMSILRQ